VTGISTRGVPNSLTGLETINANYKSTFVPYTGANNTVDLNSQRIMTTFTASSLYDLTNKSFVDTYFLNKNIVTAQAVTGLVTYTGGVRGTLGPSVGADLTNKTYVDTNFLSKTGSTDQSVASMVDFVSGLSTSSVYLRSGLFFTKENASQHAFQFQRYADGSGYLTTLGITDGETGNRLMLFTDNSQIVYRGLTLDYMTASKVPVLNANKQLVSSGVDAIKISYLDNVTSDIQAQLNSKLNLSGGTMTGNLDMGANKVTSTYYAIANSDLTNKLYVDNAVTGLAGVYVLRAGDTMTGPLIMGGNKVTSSYTPINADDLTRKGYVDTALALKVNLSGNQTINGVLTMNGVVLPAVFANRAVITNGSNALTHSATTSTELGYVSGVTSPIQTQLNTISGTFANYLPLAGGTMSGTIALGGNKITTTYTPINADDLTRKGYVDAQDALKVNLSGNQTINGVLTMNGIILPSVFANRAVITNGSNALTHSVTTNTELSYLSGTTSSVQSQIDTKASTSYVNSQDALRVLKSGDTMSGQLSVYDEPTTIDDRYTFNTFMRGWSSFQVGSESDLIYVNSSSAIVGPQVIRTDKYVWASGPRIRLDRNKTYQVEFNIRRMNPTSTSGNTFYLAVQEYTWNGVNIGGDGGQWYYPVSEVAQSSLTTAQWYNYKASVGPNGGKAHASNAYYISVGFIVNYTNTVTTDIIEMSGFRLFAIEDDLKTLMTMNRLNVVGAGSMDSLTLGPVVLPSANSAGTTRLISYGNACLYRNRLIFSSALTDWNHSIYNNNQNNDNEGSWDGMKMNVYNGLWVRTGNANGATPTTALFVDTVGKVGIGTTNPSQELHIIASSGNTEMRVEANGVVGQFMDVGTSPNNYHYLFGYGNFPLVFGTNSSERMRILGNGRVGVGTNSPGAMLEIYSTSADYTNSFLVQTVWPSITFDNSSLITGGRKWSFLCGGPGAGVGPGGLGIFDITASSYRFSINSEGNVGIGNYTSYTRFGISGGVASGSFGNTGNWVQNANAILITEAAQGPNVGGLFMGFKGDGSWITSLAPSVVWRPMYIWSENLYCYVNGGLAAYLVGGGWVNVSDSREKEDIQDLKTEKSLQRVLALKPKHYRRKYKEDAETPVSQSEKEKRHVGFIAQEVVESNSHCVSTWCNQDAKTDVDDGTRFGLSYNDYVVHLVGAVQEQQRMIKDLQSQLNEMSALLKSRFG